jgi:hypothetical protein
MKYNPELAKTKYLIDYSEQSSMLKKDWISSHVKEA